MAALHRRLTHVVFPTFELAPINPGGAGVLVSAAMRTLAQAGLRTTAVCAFPVEEVALANQFFASSAAPRGALRAIGVSELAPALPAAATDYEANSLRMAAALQALAKQEPINLIEFPDYTGLGAATLRARAAGMFPAEIRLTVRVHGTLGAIDAAEGVVADEGRRRMHAEEAWALAYADQVMVPTVDVGLQYAARYGIAPDRLLVSPPPMDLLLEGLGPIQRLVDPLHFLFYGKLQEVKGCDLFAKAAVALIRREPQRGWRFTFVARDTFCTPHQRMASECLEEVIPEDCRAHFEFIPQITRSLLPEVARTVVAAVVPSRSESFCLAAHELRALGLPLVVPDRPPFAEYFRRETGCLSFDGSPESLADQMRLLSNDATLRRELALAPLPSYPPFEQPYLSLGV